MDVEKMIQQHISMKKKTMSELIAEKHQKNEQDLNFLRKKWMPESQREKKTP